VWAALYGVPYSPPPGPYPPESGEWLFVKAIWFVSAIVLGFVATHVSGRSVQKVLLTLLAGWFVLSLAAEPLQSDSLWRIALDYLNIPAGALVGYGLWRRHQVRG
jgi:TctA family transporter